MSKKNTAKQTRNAVVMTAEEWAEHREGAPAREAARLAHEPLIGEITLIEKEPSKKFPGTFFYWVHVGERMLYVTQRELDKATIEFPNSVELAPAYFEGEYYLHRPSKQDDDGNWIPQKLEWIRVED